MKSVYAILLVVFVGAVTAQDSTKADGWYKTSWGMKKAEIVEALKEDGVRQIPKMQTKAAYWDLEIDGFVVADKKFDVIFLMNAKSDQLEQVNLSFSGNPSRTAFDGLKQKLTEKYGKASFEKQKTDGFTDLKAAWNLPGTTIELGYLDLRISEGEKPSMYIVYQKRSVDSKL